MPDTTNQTPKLARLKGVEIFATGKHKGTEYTDADLDDMVRNHRTYSAPSADGREPLVTNPAVIGHENEQPLLANSGIPKVGRVAKVWAEKGPCRWCDGSGRMQVGGDRFICPSCRGKGQQKVLKADVDQVPPSLAKLINARAYDQVSAEVYDDPPEGVPGKGKMLRRIAFLGGDLPHIKSLADLPHADYAEFREDLRLPPPPTRIRMTRVSRGVGGVVAVFSEVKRFSSEGTMPDVPTPDANQDQATPRDAALKQLTEKGLDPDVLQKFDDRQLAETMKLCKPDSGESADQFGEDELMAMPEQEGMKKLSEAVRRYCDMGKRIYGEAYDPLKDDTDPGTQPVTDKGRMGEGDADDTANTDGEPAPQKGDKPMPGLAQMSETALKQHVSRLVRSAVDEVRKELSPIKKQVQSFHEDNKVSRIDRVLAECRDRIAPWELDDTAGLPTLRDELLALDDRAGVRKFKEGGKVRDLTALDAKIEQIRRRPKLRAGELASTGKGGKDHASFAEAKKADEMAKVREFAETHATDLGKVGMTVAEFVDTYEKASPADREILLKNYAA